MKIVLNKCYGGWGLSKKALRRVAQLKGVSVFFYKSSDDYRSMTMIRATEEDKFFSCYTKDFGDSFTCTDDTNKYYLHFGDEMREDADVVRTVEELGDAASGSFAKLEIVDIPEGYEYDIDDYDGIETAVCVPASVEVIRL